MPLNNLAIRLSTRYDQLGAMEDLVVAIILGRKHSTFPRRDTLNGQCL